ncbi:hypothetical protein SAMN05421820_105307 [Pedobacter steynii]|uniref:Bacteriocin-type signal sequence-containing protein n=1 Tax=Pedobacter steynii TaxID=430522 RepID=A0A1G9WY57_9SPHI|nr:hypothetical protein [Pedobacter steynii]NQX40420.1 hypothetical protein [Pedobacter steynii]SDM89025.1 hypothetical protein SAMN05421820_105307 [Pedobacter steynii]
MKNLELTNLDVQEMSRTEMKTIEGGGLLGDFISGTLTVVITAAGAIVGDTVAYAKKQIGTVLTAIFSL